MRKILVLTDFSARAENAARYALQIAAKAKAEIILYNTYYATVPNTIGITIYDEIGVIDEASMHQLLLLAQKLKRRMSKEKLGNIPIHVQNGMGNLTGNIADIIKKQDIWMVIMGGSRKTGSFNRFILGSDTHAVIDSVTCPLLLIPEKVKAENIRHIALASELKVSERKCFSFLSMFADVFRAGIVVMHVYSGELSIERKVSYYKKYQRITKESGGIDISYTDASGEDIPATLNQFTRHEHIDIVAVVHKRQLFITRLFNSSITKALIDSQRIPLLVFPSIFKSSI